MIGGRPGQSDGRHQAEAGVVVVIQFRAGDQAQAVRNQNNLVLDKAGVQLRIHIGGMKRDKEAP